jgi:signal recognition particle subunit SRP54
VFEALSDKLQQVFHSLRSRGTLSEQDIESALREVRLALLEADVHFQVVKGFLERVRARATGQEILRSLTPVQGVLRVVRDEMVATLGGATTPRLLTSSRPPCVVFLVGLQGSGKTTSAAKLGVWLTRGGHHPLLVSTDTRRPAAREQLRQLGEKAHLNVHHPEGLETPLALLRSALAEARAIGHDHLLVDTAGRLHIDDELMTELEELRALAQPSETLFVGDSMTGQDAVRSAAEFRRRTQVTGIVLTKLDGDARGGAALSIAAVAGVPIKFAGVGERLEDFEPFQAERMVSRILGMGDILSLIERAEETVDREQAEELVRKLRRSEFSLDDYRSQLAQVKRLGPLDKVLSMVPGLGAAAKDVDVDAGERELKRATAILDSMTAEERRNPSVLNGSRRKRIARGSGTRVEDVNRLLKQFAQTRRIMQSVGGGQKAMRRMAERLRPFH